MRAVTPFDAVPDGRAAIEYLRGYDYEVVVLDWRMPGVSGLRCCSGCAGTPGPPGPDADRPGHAPDRVTGLDQGADDYLVKPFDFSELLARLRALQRRPRTA